MESLQDLGQYTFKALLCNSVNKFADRPALALVGKKEITYKELNDKSIEISKLLLSFGLKTNSKIAIFATGRPEWGIAYFAIVNSGMIAVPLLPDFSDTEVLSIITHCEIDAIFVDNKLYEKLKKIEDKLPEIIIKLEDFSIIKGNIQKSISEKDLEAIDISEENIASIIYTSGTTGRSKGVVLTHKNLIWNAIGSQWFHRINKMDRCLSFLPLSHVYEFTIGFAMQMMNGSCVYYLGKPPVVSALLKAFAIVKPTIVLSVPLIMEKIYKNKVLPTIQKNKVLKFLYTLPFAKKILNRAAGKNIMKTFGGHLVFFGIGGAKVDPKVEQFMKDAKFPYAVGYGLTETAPLLAGCNVNSTIPGTIGPVIPGVDMKIINKNNKGVGEIVVKGPNVMSGYYKDEALTKEAFTNSEDECGAGYFKTGDLGIFVKKHKELYLALKGRSKNMILGPSGENIYPEDIEFVLNQHSLVSESLVVEDDSGLVALVKVDEELVKDEAEKRSRLKFPDIKEISEDFIRDVAYQREQILGEIQFFVNSRVNKGSYIAKIQKIEEFEKTASQKIKRYLYDLRSKKNKKK